MTMAAIISMIRKIFCGENPSSNPIADTWNNKWKQNKIIYKAQGIYEMDVRNLIFNKSHVLEKKKFKGTDDEKAIAILKYVKSNMKYISDDINYNEAEYWQDPEVTLQKKTGDCEDGALLVASLMRCNGIPAYKVKVCAGWVKNNSESGQGGHAYVIYLADDDKWYVLDWCYYGNDSINNFKKVQHSKCENYKEIWWTFNDEYSWAQKTTKLNSGV